MHRLRGGIGKFGLVCLGTLLGSLLLEGALRLRAHVVTVSPELKWIPDERLAFRPNPNYPGHDARGWRNPSALTRADIVVFGDSQTWGINVPGKVAARATWPQGLGLRLDRTVYQMALDGYGPAQYALLLEDALALEPKVIVAAYYFGNDLYDSYQFLYGAGRRKRTVLDPLFGPEFAQNDPKTRESIARAETIDPELLRHRYLDCRRPIEVPDSRLQTTHDVLALPPLARLAHGGPLQQAGAYLADNSVVLEILRDRLLPTTRVRLRGEEHWPQLCLRYRHQALTTVFSPAYRFVALDSTDPRIVEGERISFLAFKHIAERCRQRHCSFYVVLIPTKETAFRAETHSSLRDQSHMVDLWNAEARARTHALAFLAHEQIAAIDTLPALEALIASGVNPYPESADGHPVRIGYGAIARAVAERLESDGDGW